MYHVPKTTLTFFTNLRCSVLKFWEISNSVKALKWPRNSDANDRKRGIERVQALADVLRSVLCCHSNETCAPIAYLPNTAQLEGIPYHSPNYIRVHAVMWECGEEQTDTQMAVATIHFASATPHMKSTEHHPFLIHQLVESNQQVHLKLILFNYMLRYEDGEGNTTEENSSVSSLIRMR